MSFINHFFHATCLGTNINYIMSYVFFIVSMIFIILVLTQTNIISSTERDTSVIKFILILVWMFISCVFSRCICYDKSKYIKNNDLLYEEAGNPYV